MTFPCSSGSRISTGSLRLAALPIRVALDASIVSPFSPVSLQYDIVNARFADTVQLPSLSLNSSLLVCALSTRFILQLTINKALMGFVLFLWPWPLQLYVRMIRVNTIWLLPSCSAYGAVQE